MMDSLIEILRRILHIERRIDRLESLETPAIGGGGVGAPNDAQYVVLALDAGLTAERVLTEGPDIDLVDGGANGTITVGRGGDTILLFDSGGNPLAEYAATDAGLTAALAAATSGDVVQLPACAIAGGPWTVPAGVEVAGLGWNSYLNGTAGGDGYLSDLRVATLGGTPGSDAVYGFTAGLEGWITYGPPGGAYTFGTAEWSAAGGRSDAGCVLLDSPNLYSGNPATTGKSSGIYLATSVVVEAGKSLTAYFYCIARTIAGTGTTDCVIQLKATYSDASTDSVTATNPPIGSWQQLTVALDTGKTLTRVDVVQYANSESYTSYYVDDITVPGPATTELHLHGVRCAAIVGESEMSDRAAWDVLNYEDRHASDIATDLPTRHLPPPTTDGDIVQARGGIWVSWPPPTAGPHHVLSTTHDDSDSAHSPAEGESLVYRSSQWTGEAAVGIESDSANIAGVNFEDGSGEPTPTTDHHVMYSKSDGVYIKDDAGTEVGPLGASMAGSGGGDHVHGLFRWAADGGATVDLIDIAEYLEAIADDGAIVDPATYTLSADGSQVVFDTGPTAASVMAAQYVIERI